MSLGLMMIKKMNIGTRKVKAPAKQDKTAASTFLNSECELLKYYSAFL